MKNYIKYILFAVIFVAVIVGAGFGYKYLSEQYQPDDLTGQSTEDSSTKNKGNGKAPTIQSVEKASDFTVVNMSGDKVNLSDYFGKPIVINFWASWCGPCKLELPSFDKVYQDNKDDVVFLMVNLTDGSRETIESVTDFVSENGYSFPLYFDTKYLAASAYNVNSIPLTIFIDKNGEVQNSHVGMIRESVLQKNVEELKAVK